MRLFLCAAAASSLLCGAPAAAQEVWGGVFAHDVEFLGSALGVGVSKREEGFDLQAGVRSRPLGVLWRPRAYAIASVNTAGDTSFAGAGLLWRAQFGRRFYVQPGVGLAYHTGFSELPDFREPGITAAEAQRRAALRADEKEYGAKVLIQPELSLGYAFSDRLAGELSYVHLSNGRLYGEGQNDGLDMVGARVVYRFGDR
jgi:hypothetical protein